MTSVSNVRKSAIPAPPDASAPKVDADGSVKVTDGRGRVLTIRRPSFLQEFRIAEAVGPETAKNVTYMEMLNPLIWIGEINGQPVDFPQTHREAEALIEECGRDGHLCALAAMVTHFADENKELADAIKNAVGTTV